MARLITKCKTRGPYGGLSCKRGKRRGFVRYGRAGLWEWVVRTGAHGRIIARGEHTKAVAVAKVREFLKTKHKGYGD